VDPDSGQHARHQELGGRTRIGVGENDQIEKCNVREILKQDLEEAYMGGL
jgi:hypothetical protein